MSAKSHLVSTLLPLSLLLFPVNVSEVWLRSAEHGEQRFLFSVEVGPVYVRTPVK